MKLPYYARLDQRLPCIHWPLWSIKLWKRIFWVLIFSQTTATRFWFGWASIGFASFLYYSTTIHSSVSEYVIMGQIAPHNIWAVLFLIHGLSLWYGVFSRSYSKPLLLLEGVLGMALWASSAIAVVIAQHSLGAQVAGAMIQFWILMRYPTHWEHTDAI